MASITLSPWFDPYAHNDDTEWTLSSVLPTRLVFETADTMVVLGGTGFAINGAQFAGSITSFQVFQLDTSGAALVSRPLAQTTTALTGLTLQGLVTAISSAEYSYSWAGFDYLLSGNDSVTGSAADDEFEGGAGNDTLIGGDGNDYLQGDSYSYYGSMNGGRDSLVGGNGDDHLDGGANIDTMVGGAGNDSYFVSQAGDLVIEAAASGGYDRVMVNGGSSGLTSYTLTAYVENLDISNYNYSGYPNASATPFVGRGNELANKISTVNSSAGSIEYLYGLGGNDRLSSGDGNDVLDGGTGIDTMLGGSGSDTYVVDSLSDVISENVLGTSAADLDTVVVQIASAGTYSLGGAAGGLTVTKAWTGIEKITLGGTLAQNAVGSAAANTLTGNSAANKLYGLGGNDILLGGLGNDTLDGGTENDALTGGLGSDLLTGGAGNDFFTFTGIADMGLGLARDTISDLATGDKLDFRTFDNNATLAGIQDLNFTFLGTGAFTANSATGQLRFQSGVLYGNTDADTAAEFEIALTGRTTLSLSDFLL
ncbi:calcium-binding protein [Azohydromonas caseinilytica]|uniref:Calcium-binding protein n=1 Tax=Azohydromonas caseinilytica TaxID=2728836 RepID=A0A848F854_9BURK|nr:calcium-binding protein [Azohydromonas caseinilytica]NML14221.1 calcium-binding protein [Azohydromonas caseinilytica]